MLLLDVVEHIPDDVSFLKSLSSNKAITPATSVVITVRDSVGVSATATASVRSTVLLNAITVRSSTG